MADFDVIVLGAGPGGYLAAERAGQAGLKALLIEKQHIGGTCLNEGCIPTKTLLRSAKLYHSALHAEPYAVKCGEASIDQAAVVARKRNVTANLVAGVKGGLKASKVKTIEGEGTVEGRDNDGIIVKVNGETYHGKNLVVATGSRPIVPGIEGLDEALKSGFVVTSTELLELEKIPSKLVVIGGGVIGLEMATYYAMVGSEIEIVEAAAKVAGTLDKDATDVIVKACEDLGIWFNFLFAAAFPKSGQNAAEFENHSQ